MEESMKGISPIDGIKQERVKEILIEQIQKTLRQLEEQLGITIIYGQQNPLVITLSTEPTEALWKKVVDILQANLRELNDTRLRLKTNLINQEAAQDLDLAILAFTQFQEIISNRILF